MSLSLNLNGGGQATTTNANQNGNSQVNGHNNGASPSKKLKRNQGGTTNASGSGGGTSVPAIGLFKSDTVQDVADSLGITNLSENIASALASDLEYRLHQIIDEASRFTRHSRRSTLTTSDVDEALKVLNIEPLYGHSPLNPPAWKRAIPSIGPPVYFLQDEEIDFEKVLKVDKVPIPRGIRYTAHWLAIEGVQPLVPENPTPPKPSSAEDPTKAQAGTTLANGNNQSQGISSLPSPPNSQTGPSRTSQSSRQQVSAPPQRATARLSKELQLYYKRLTDVLLSSLPSVVKEKERDKEEKKRMAALASLKGDSGLQPLLPYLVRWVGEGVRGTLMKESGREEDEEDGDGDRDGEDDGERRRRGTEEEVDEDADRERLDIFLDAIEAMLDNKALFVELYLHQLLPPILSILLTSILSSSSPSNRGLPITSPTTSTLRSHAASLLGKLLRLHLPTYPSLSPRITKTLLGALVDPEKMLGTREGALRGLCAVGKEAVKRGIVGIRGVKVVGEETERAREMGMETESAEQAVMKALLLLRPRSSQSPGRSTDDQSEAQTPINPPTSSIFLPHSYPLSEYDPNDIQTMEKLKDILGDYFAMKAASDGAWARSLVEEFSDDSSTPA